MGQLRCSLVHIGNWYFGNNIHIYSLLYGILSTMKIITGTIIYTGGMIQLPVYMVPLPKFVTNR